MRAVRHVPGLISLDAGFDSRARDIADVAQSRQRHQSQKLVSVGSSPTVGTTRGEISELDPAATMRAKPNGWALVSKTSAVQVRLLSLSPPPPRSSVAKPSADNR